MPHVSRSRFQAPIRVFARDILRNLGKTITGPITELTSQHTIWLPKYSAGGNLGVQPRAS